MVIEQEESVPSGPAFEIAYQTKLVSIKKPYSITVIYSTQNDACSADDKEKAKAYGIMTEYLANKNSRPNPTQVTAYCKVLHEITGSTYPLVMKELGINLTNMVVYVGGLEANFESYHDEGAVAWWQCNWMYGGSGPSGGWKCMPNQIVVCDECRLIGTFSDTAVRDRDPEDPKLWHLTLAGTLHHSEGELVTHLFNVQRLKLAQGFQPKVDLPNIGYWTLSDWDRSMP